MGIQGFFSVPAVLRLRSISVPALQRLRLDTVFTRRFPQQFAFEHAYCLATCFKKNGGIVTYFPVSGSMLHVYLAL
jgi:hypothetical protein